MKKILIAFISVVTAGGASAMGSKKPVLENPNAFHNAKCTVTFGNLHVKDFYDQDQEYYGAMLTASDAAGTDLLDKHYVGGLGINTKRDLVLSIESSKRYFLSHGICSSFKTVRSSDVYAPE